MRNLFRGYYRPTKEEFDHLWNNCVFSFDTNILLNVYRYTPKTRERFFDILDKLQEKIWLPYQVAYEYQEERLNVISQQLKPYSELQKSLDEHFENFQKILEKYSKRHSFSDFVDIKQFIEVIERAYEKVKEVLAESKLNYPDLLDQDDFREKLSDLFESRVGQPYSEEDLVKIYKEAEKRFKNSCPPGYMDSRGSNKKEPPECYGDVVIWFQLINYAEKQKKSLIFVTDDQKEDWWLEHRGKILGPRPELIQEMFAKANVPFYLYTGERFLAQASIFLSLSSEPEVVEEAREIGLQDEEQQFTQDPASLLRQIEQLRSMPDPVTLLGQIEQLRSMPDPTARWLEQFRSIPDPTAKMLERFRAKMPEQLRSMPDPTAKWLEQSRSMPNFPQVNTKNIENQSQQKQEEYDEEEADESDNQSNEEQTEE